MCVRLRIDQVLAWGDLFARTNHWSFTYTFLMFWNGMSLLKTNLLFFLLLPFLTPQRHNALEQIGEITVRNRKTSIHWCLGEDIQHQFAKDSEKQRKVTWQQWHGLRRNVWSFRQLHSPGPFLPALWFLFPPLVAGAKHCGTLSLHAAALYTHSVTLRTRWHFSTLKYLVHGATLAIVADAVCDFYRMTHCPDKAVIENLRHSQISSKVFVWCI